MKTKVCLKYFVNDCRSKTLIDNVFSTDTNEEVTSGNILTSISDHLAQFLISPLSQSNRDK